MRSMIDAEIHAENSNSDPGNGDRGGRVSFIGIHPVKSLAALEPKAWWFGPQGPDLDRRWMVVDGDGRFLSLREVPELIRLRPSFLEPWGPKAEPGILEGNRLPRVRLQDDHGSIEFQPTDRPDTSRARLWKAERVIVDEGDDLAHWLSGRLGRPARLVRHRPDLDPWTQPEPEAMGATTGLADGYPVLVVAEQTIMDAVGPEYSPRRFRANIIVKDAPPAAEDCWLRIAIGDLELDLVKPCVRCVATMVHPDLGINQGPEPLATLRRTRLWNRKPVLGWNALVRGSGTVSIGDDVRILERRKTSPVAHQSHQVRE